MEDPLIRSSREISKTVTAYIEGDDVLSAWLETRCETWEVEPTGFLRRLSVLLFVSCHSVLARPLEEAPEGLPLPLASLKDALENSSSAQIFAALHSSPAFVDLVDAQELWIISTGVTNVRALYWSRLRYAATEILTKILAREGQECTMEHLVKPERS
ncbi:hypothetical protein [Streptomyces sp. MNP-20]|uniref:hypothetical protein n=1 Tax=Streptomyces sp. MNP-20 TaxID=2721165 RepID=UPI0015547324|nr:hypothetical protein [Streptomyces sp. MNP-20]